MQVLKSEGDLWCVKQRMFFAVTRMEGRQNEALKCIGRERKAGQARHPDGTFHARGQDTGCNANHETEVIRTQKHRECYATLKVKSKALGPWLHPNKTPKSLILRCYPRTSAERIAQHGHQLIKRRTISSEQANSVCHSQRCKLWSHQPRHPPLSIQNKIQKHVISAAENDARDPLWCSWPVNRSNIMRMHSSLLNTLPINCPRKSELLKCQFDLQVPLEWLVIKTAFWQNRYTNFTQN